MFSSVTSRWCAESIGARRPPTAARCRLEDHPGARINLGLTFLRWERPRGHHDPAWPIDPRETGRARRALEVWSRQTRILLALAFVVAGVVAFGFGLVTEAKIGGGAMPLVVLAITLRQAHRVRLWPYVPGMLARDLWLSMSVSITLSVRRLRSGVATLPGAGPALASARRRTCRAGLGGSRGAGPFQRRAVLVLRVLVEAWRGRPVSALAEFTRPPERPYGPRDVDVTLGWWRAGPGRCPARSRGGRRPGRAAMGLPAAPCRSCSAGCAAGAGRAGLDPCLGPALATDRWLGRAGALACRLSSPARCGGGRPCSASHRRGRLGRAGRDRAAGRAGGGVRHEVGTGVVAGCAGAVAGSLVMCEAAAGACPATWDSPGGAQHGGARGLHLRAGGWCSRTPIPVGRARWPSGRSARSARAANCA